MKAAAIFFFWEKKGILTHHLNLKKIKTKRKKKLSRRWSKFLFRFPLIKTDSKHNNEHAEVAETSPVILKSNISPTENKNKKKGLGLYENT